MFKRSMGIAVGRRRRRAHQQRPRCSVMI